MIICPRCRQSNEAAARFCGRCGDYIEEAGRTVEPARAAPSQRQGPPPEVVVPISPVSPGEPPAGKPTVGPVDRPKTTPPPVVPTSPSAIPAPASAPVGAPPMSGRARETRFCSRCGTSNPTDRALCQRCGAELFGLTLAGAAPTSRSPRLLAPASSVLERLRSEDAERLVPGLLAGSLAASILALIVAGLVLLGDGYTPRTPVAIAPPLSRTAAASVTPSPLPSGSATAGSTASASPTASVPPAPVDAEAASRILLDAWYRGDRPAALQVANEPAVDQLFATPPPETALPLQECHTSGTAVWDCQFSAGAQTLVIRVIPVSENVFRVEEIRFV